MNQQEIEGRFSQALSFLQQGQAQDAYRLFSQLHQVLPAQLDILFLLGAAASALGQRTEALGYYDLLLDNTPDFVPALNAKGLDLTALGRHEEALMAFDAALCIAPQFVEAILNKAALLNELARYRETLALLQPHHEMQHSQLQVNLGVAYFKLGDFVSAGQCAQRALKLTPHVSEALVLQSALCLKRKEHTQALAYCHQAAAMNPQDASIQNNMAAIMAEQGDFAEAAQSYAQTLLLDDAYPFARGSLLHTCMKAAIWDEYNELVARVSHGIHKGQMESDPFSLLGSSVGAADQKRCAEIYIKSRYPYVEPYRSWKRLDGCKIRVAYLSADFFNHATAFLMAELFELHDRERFEIIGICYGRSHDDDMRQRIIGAFDQFYTVADQSDRDIAKFMHDLEIDIAVDLKGHTADTRLGILAYRPAPIQVHYLGYPGTTGAPFIDYLVADSVLIPPEQASFYTEKIAYLPGCYQVNDSKRKISERIFTRRELGLPDSGFVFCSFNNNFKITPDLFDVWMRLLNRVEGSVLWLFQDNLVAAENLRKEALARGVASDRLIFAERMPLAEHLSRHRCADLFLDTWYCNAHTTASDALWAGLPIVSKLGNTFAGRIASSLLTAMDCVELIVESTQAYEELAYDLAKNPDKLNSLRLKIQKNRQISSLFDTTRFTRCLESAFERMVSKHRQGLLPDQFYI